MEMTKTLAYASRAATTLGKFLCSLRGHCLLLDFSDHRVSLLCANCGHQTPGIELGPPRYK